MATSGTGSTSQRVKNWMENDANGLDNELLIAWIVLQLPVVALI